MMEDEQELTYLKLVGCGFQFDRNNTDGSVIMVFDGDADDPYYSAIRIDRQGEMKFIN